MLFEALDKSFLLGALNEDNAGSADLVTEMYEGVMADYIRCHTCGTLGPPICERAVGWENVSVDVACDKERKPWESGNWIGNWIEWVSVWHVL